MIFENGKTFGEMGINANPLAWPTGWKRTSARKKSNFRTSFARARDQLFRELKLMGVADWNVILSSNLALRRDGLPYANLANPLDPGVAVYFRYQNKPRVFACDTYRKVEENLYAIVLTIGALRGIDRWGASDMMERAFTGFAALPPPATISAAWWTTFGFAEKPNPTPEAYQVTKVKRNDLAKQYHPDLASHPQPDKMAAVNAAWNEAEKYFSNAR